MDHSMTIEDVIRMTAANLKDICASPVHMSEDIRYKLAMNYRNLEHCIAGIEQSKQTRTEEAQKKVRNAPEAVPCDAEGETDA